MIQFLRNFDKKKLSFLLILFFFVFSALSLFSSGQLESEDGWLYSTVSRNIYYNHKATSAPDEYPQKNVHMNTSLQKDGTWRAPYALGYSIAMVPAVFLSDMVHRYYHSKPPVHFPLESDWSLLLFASFTNMFLAGILAVAMFLYGQALKFTNKESFWLALLTIFATNLFPLSKFSFPHMMQIPFIVLTFLFVKLFSTKKDWRYLMGAIVMFGIAAIGYNQTCLLALPGLFVYFVLLYRNYLTKKIISTFIIVSLLVIALFLKLFFEASTTLIIPRTEYIEAIWGFLLSPGKSIFLYSPILLLIPFFWFKIKKIEPEIIAFTVLSITYILIYASTQIHLLNGTRMLIWYGGLVWGPRYLGILLPFLLIIVFLIYQNFSQFQRKFIFIPLCIISFFVQIIGISVPYLVEYRGLPNYVSFGETTLTQYEYGSFIPRMSPLITMTKIFAADLIRVPSTIMHGRYNARFYDGFDMPHRVAGNEYYRGFKEDGYIAFDRQDNRQWNIDLQLYNAPDEASRSASTVTSIFLNNKKVKTIQLTPLKNTSFSFVVPSNQKTNILHLQTITPKKFASHTYIQQMKLNDQSVNLRSLDYPDFTPISKVTKPWPYQYFGKVITSPWDFWYLRARIYESTLDFWWIRNFYYWDRPKSLIFFLFGLDLIAVAVSGRFLYKLYKKL